MNLQTRDELGNEVGTSVFATDTDQVNSTSKVLLNGVFYVLAPNKTVPFSFLVQKPLYHKTIENKTPKQKRKILFVDPYSTLGNGYFFKMELQDCHPGFVFSDDSKNCVCDTSHEGVQR